MSRSKIMEHYKEMRRGFYPMKKLRSAASMCRKKLFLMPPTASSASFTFLVSIVCFATLFTKTTLALTTPKPNTILQVFMNETIPDIDYRTLPRVGKCCSIDEVLVKDENGESKCVSISSRSSQFNSTGDDNLDAFSPLFSDFNKTGALAPGDKYDRFLAIVGDPCRFKWYMLSPSETSDDEYYLLLNGSIFAPRHVSLMLSPGIDYCMEFVPGLGTIALVCFPEDVDARLVCGFGDLRSKVASGEVSNWLGDRLAMQLLAHQSLSGRRSFSEFLIVLINGNTVKI